MELGGSSADSDEDADVKRQSPDGDGDGSQGAARVGQSDGLGALEYEDSDGSLQLTDDIDRIDSRTLLQEVISLFRLGLPVSAGYLLQNSLGIASVICVGRLGTLELAASALATMFCNVTGLSVGIGLSSALDTLCGQAHTGSRDRFAAGKHLQRSLVLMVATTLIVSVIWIYAESILLLCFQDPEISRLAGEYLLYLLPGLFPFFAFECLKRFLQSQGIMN
ncbi:MAG: hypothetical protein SGCHY_003104, partial [Lobulomycetales sp.]